MDILENDVEILRQRYITWIENRQKARKELTELADKLNEHQTNVNIAKVTGSTAAIAGTGLMIGGFAASFFTFGASLIVSAVGAGISGAGGITAGGASIAKYFLDKDIYEEAQRSLDQDQECTEALQSSLNKLKLQVESLKELGTLDHDGLDTLFTAGWTAGSCLKSFGKNIVYESIQAAKTVKAPARLAFAVADLATDSGLSVFKSLSNVGRAFHIGGFVVGVVLLPVDIYTLVTSSIELHKGTSEAEKKIRDIVDKMECPNKEDIPDIIRKYLTELLVE